MGIKKRLLGSCALFVLPFAAAPALADESGADLQTRLDALKERLAALENDQNAPTERVAPAQAVTGGAFPGSWKLPGSDTSISFSGYVKADSFFTFNAPSTAIGDSFILSNIPIKGSAANSQGGDFRMHSKQSRIRFETRTPTDWGNLVTRIESDFYTNTGNQRVSNSDTMRIRQAYGVLGPVLAGQTQSTFMDEDTFAGSLMDPSRTLKPRSRARLAPA
ncbi:MAG: DcaP family trimeric outer membrane transporter [Alphaproteobacteria bacterium]|nr:DcaP family trimeric outer membrane transporter [Alphaproteobacteria bacterium]